MSSNPASILDSTKKVLGFDGDYTAFDLDITMLINSTFGSLRQLGVGPDTGFIISDNTTLWTQYVADLTYLGLVQAYIYKSVQLAFDTPGTSFGIDAIKTQIGELAWRINIAAEQADPPADPFDHHIPDLAEDGVMKTYFAPKVVNLVFAPIVTPDASQGNMFYLTMTANCTINFPVNGGDGEHITLEITSNGFTATWGTGWNFGSAGTPTLSPDSSDVISAYYKESATSWRAGFTPGF